MARGAGARADEGEGELDHLGVGVVERGEERVLAGRGEARRDARGEAS